MADEQQTDAKAQGSGKTSGASTDEPEERYTVEQLEDASRVMFGVSRHAVTGALATDHRKTYTKQQATELIDEFMGREVS